MFSGYGITIYGLEQEKTKGTYAKNLPINCYWESKKLLHTFQGEFKDGKFHNGTYT